MPAPIPSETISNMPNATLPLDGTELVPIIQGGISKKVTVANLMKAILLGAGANAFLYNNAGAIAFDSAIRRTGSGSVEVTNFAVDSSFTGSGNNYFGGPVFFAAQQGQSGSLTLLDGDGVTQHLVTWAFGGIVSVT